MKVVLRDAPRSILNGDSDDSVFRVAAELRVGFDVLMLADQVRNGPLATPPSPATQLDVVPTLRRITTAYWDACTLLVNVYR